MCPVIGLTGGIGCGKSSLAAYLAQKGAAVVDADKTGHQVLARSGEAFAEVVALFGPSILDDTGEINRAALGELVFSRPESLKALTRISHPAMARRMEREIARLRAATPPPPAIVLEAAVLFEAGWDSLCDMTWTVSAPEQMVVERLAPRWSPEQIQARIQTQWSNTRRESKADHTLINDKTAEALYAQADRLWHQALGREKQPPAR